MIISPEVANLSLANQGKDDDVEEIKSLGGDEEEELDDADAP